MSPKYLFYFIKGKKFDKLIFFFCFVIGDRWNNPVGGLYILERS